ncbi:hypothetical protein ROZALSC1DRAFT_28102 [Rozella allomycis CSF55]|uniref:Uncharacterized protein n=1 Tax=Rozella allomycis (strain CSF55) TaxID=988480 RepID=A0A075AP86_ROZAC|nr:hypothetical protein O9G_000277 [Rozella allomycis CSF55]RKP20398.1 hypothetical protein ROZALSC1DRAFT_28102 [Rozella allomycis CSF55]|eukprot:EPZ31798.1 hypothetical protein O9G_000277 [Rozella allomycis CSF55]
MPVIMNYWIYILSFIAIPRLWSQPIAPQLVLAGLGSAGAGFTGGLLIKKGYSESKASKEHFTRILNQYQQEIEKEKTKVERLTKDLENKKVEVKAMIKKILQESPDQNQALAVIGKYLKENAAANAALKAKNQNHLQSESPTNNMNMINK